MRCLFHLLHLVFQVPVFANGVGPGVSVDGFASVFVGVLVPSVAFVGLEIGASFPPLDFFE
jgi:hypothetical protein